MVPDDAADADADALELGLEPPGTEEVAVVPWPLLWQRRAAERVGRSPRYPWLVVVASLFGLFSVGFTITVLTIATARIAEDFGTTQDVVIWVVTGPILLSAIVTPSAGKLTDLLGARRVYLVTMAGFALFAGLAALSWSIASLIAFRILGAMMGAATGPAAIAMINRLFPRERRAQALGYWSLVAAFGPVLGVVVGGPVVEHVSWRWIFVAQVPLALLTVLVGAIVFPRMDRVRGVRFDVVGAVLLSTGIGAFVLALNRAPAAGWGWTNPLVLAGFALCPVALGAFAWYESRIEHQLVPLRYFRRRNFAFPMGNAFFANFAYMGAFYVTPLLMRGLLGYGESEIGFVSIIRPLFYTVAGPLAGWAATRVGERINGIVGGLCLLASMLVFSLVAPGRTDLLIFAALALSGIGMGATAPAMTAVVANTVDERDLGVVGAGQQTLQQVGVVVGMQVMVTVQQVRAPVDGAATGFSEAYLVGAAAAAAALVCALFVRSTVGRKAEARLAAAAVGTGTGTGAAAPAAARPAPVRRAADGTGLPEVGEAGVPLHAAVEVGAADVRTADLGAADVRTADLGAADVRTADPTGAKR